MEFLRPFIDWASEPANSTLLKTIAAFLGILSTLFGGFWAFYKWARKIRQFKRQSKSPKSEQISQSDVKPSAEIAKPQVREPIQNNAPVKQSLPPTATANTLAQGDRSKPLTAASYYKVKLIHGLTGYSRGRDTDYVRAGDPTTKEGQRWFLTNALYSFGEPRGGLESYVRYDADGVAYVVTASRTYLNSGLPCVPFSPAPEPASQR